MLADTYQIPHEWIHFEVTESAYTDNPQKMISAVTALRDMGFKIEMDDFGSGYSSLNMLSELPIDILKLDMRFMQNGKDCIKDGKRNILSFIISLSKWLQLPTVAEGVETQEEVDTLKAMGCDYIQGFYYAKPMPADEFEAYLKANTEKHKAPAADHPCLSMPAWDSDKETKPLVLVAEDLASNRELLKELLQRDYRVVTAENGMSARRCIQERRAEISCILLDLLMPVMDGFQLLEMLRGDGTMDEIPVIITTENESSSELRALHLGADSFVAKPYNPEILLHHVKKAVEEKNFWKIKHQFECESSVLYQRAYQDELTGLFNRHGLKQAMAQLPANEQHMAIMLDIDNLKAVNDTYGHASGDKIIKTVAEILKKATRNEDVISRVGGDEFFVILEGMTDEKTALKKAQSLCDTVRLSDAQYGDLHTSCSAGVTRMDKLEDLETVYQRVDKALYKAKRAGKGTCRFDEEKTPE